MLNQAQESRVSVRWLMEQLGERSFGLTLFMMAVIAFIAGASTVSFPVWRFHVRRIDTGRRCHDGLGVTDLTVPPREKSLGCLRVADIPRAHSPA
jgi:hypothetical protein